MINQAVPNTIFEKALNNKGNLSNEEKKENLSLALNSATSIGCSIKGINANQFLEKKTEPILTTIFEILKNNLLSKVNLKDCPGLIKVKKENEEISDLIAIPPEDLLLRWFNFHLKNANSPNEVKNYSDDIKSGENYVNLLNQLNPDLCNKDGLTMALDARCKKVVNDSKLLGVPNAFEGENISKGHPRLNLLLVASLFKACPNLKATENELKELNSQAGMLEDDTEGSREERSFRMWVNSLGNIGRKVTNLYEDIKDGIVLLKVMDRVEKVVDWKKVEMNPNHRIKKINNCHYAVKCGKDMGFSLVGIGGIDFVDGNKKLTLALFWQLVRKNTLKVLGGWSEEKLLKWAQSRVEESKITSFKDKSISNCKFLFNLLASIDSKAINHDLIAQGEENEDLENNAKYVISVARKIGATIFIVWEDIKNVNPKMIMTFVAALAKVVEIGNVDEEEMPDVTGGLNK